MSLSKLYDILKPKEGKLNIDCVFINIENGEDIGKVFKRLHVPQIFTWTKKVSDEKKEEEDDGIEDATEVFRTVFSNEMIVKLIEE